MGANLGVSSRSFEAMFLFSSVVNLLEIHSRCFTHVSVQPSQTQEKTSWDGIVKIFKPASPVGRG